MDIGVGLTSSIDLSGRLEEAWFDFNGEAGKQFDSRNRLWRQLLYLLVLVVLLLGSGWSSGCASLADRGATDLTEGPVRPQPGEPGSCAPLLLLVLLPSLVQGSCEG
jgi:hypothetical protein